MGWVFCVYFLKVGQFLKVGRSTVASSRIQTCETDTRDVYFNENITLGHSQMNWLFCKTCMFPTSVCLPIANKCTRIPTVDCRCTLCRRLLYIGERARALLLLRRHREAPSLPKVRSYTRRRVWSLDGCVGFGGLVVGCQRDYERNRKFE